MVVLVGTGKFLEPNDKNLASLGTQTFYGLYDANTASTTAIAGRSQLTQQTITFEDLVTFGTTQVATRWGQITKKLCRRTHTPGTKSTRRVIHVTFRDR